MFPHARNSLRRWSSTNDEAGGGCNNSSQPTMPIPIGVSLHNVIQSAAAAKPTSTTTNPPVPAFRQRPRHEIHLLPVLQLEILVRDDMDDSDNDDNGDGDVDKDANERNTSDISSNRMKYRSVYTCPNLARSVQPEWEHLDERIEFPAGENEQWWSSSSRGGRMYKTMRLRITQILSPTTEEEEDGKIQEPPSDHLSDSTNTKSQSQCSKVPFLEIPLHPSQLERLSVEDYHVPESLPPNACFVYFSDGSTRCSPGLFSILLRNKLTEPSPVEDYCCSRFTDDVFLHLDGVGPADGGGATALTRLRSESVSALLEADDDDNDTKQRRSQQQQQTNENSHDGRLIDAFDGPDEEKQQEQSEIMKEEATVLSPLFEDSEEIVMQADCRKEQERLLALIAREEKQLEEEIALLQEEREEMASLLKEAKQVERHIHLVEAATKKQTIEFRKDEFRKEAQHMKLLRELQSVYPISMGDSRKGYMIRNLRLPVDIYTTTVPEDESSAALGFCCHLVFMMSKYLSVSLRYRLFCNSSRSAIQLDGNTFLPLFTSRSVEREHLERAMGLLGANVDCMLMSLGIDFTPNSHILARLKRVYDQIIDGEIPMRIHG